MTSFRERIAGAHLDAADFWAGRKTRLTDPDDVALYRDADDRERHHRDAARRLDVLGEVDAVIEAEEATP